MHWPRAGTGMVAWEACREPFAFDGGLDVYVFGTDERDRQRFLGLVRAETAASTAPSASVSTQTAGATGCAGGVTSRAIAAASGGGPTLLPAARLGAPPPVAVVPAGG